MFIALIRNLPSLPVGFRAFVNRCCVSFFMMSIASAVYKGLLSAQLLCRPNHFGLSASSSAARGHEQVTLRKPKRQPGQVCRVSSREARWLERVVRRLYYFGQYFDKREDLSPAGLDSVDNFHSPFCSPFDFTCL
jgi:hypothetical protein